MGGGALSCTDINSSRTSRIVRPSTLDTGLGRGLGLILPTLEARATTGNSDTEEFPAELEGKSPHAEEMDAVLSVMLTHALVVETEVPSPVVPVEDFLCSGGEVKG